MATGCWQGGLSRIPASYTSTVKGTTALDSQSSLLGELGCEGVTCNEWMACGAWVQVISQQSPSVVVSWSDTGLFNSMFYAFGPSSFQTDSVCGAPHSLQPDLWTSTEPLCG